MFESPGAQADVSEARKAQQGPGDIETEGQVRSWKILEISFQRETIKAC